MQMRHPTVAHLRDLVSNVIYFIFQYALHAEVAGNDQFVLGHQYSPYIGDVSCFVSNHHNWDDSFAQERGFADIELAENLRSGAYTLS